MSQHPIARRRAAAALAGAVGVACLAGPGRVEAAPPTPKPAPCPGTGAPVPPGAPAAAPGRPATPAATTTAAAVPPPVIPKRDVVVGGDRLGGNGLVVDLPAGTPPPPVLNTTSWVIADATTGDVVAAKAPHALLRPASTVKALTALALLPTLDPKKVVVATPSDMQADGTKVGIVAGNRYPSSQLMAAMLMASANDAVYALARTAPGGTAQVVSDANSLAKRLGALDTVVKDPSGLDVEGQVSSAYDLALIGRAALQDKQFRGYSTTRNITFPGATLPGGRRKVMPYAVQNHNRLLYNYAGTIGVKNGYTTLAHGTFIAAATRGGRTYLLTYMCGDFISWRHMAASLDWAFTHGHKARPVGELVAPGSLTATPSATPSSTTTMTAATPQPTTPQPTTSAPAASALPEPVRTWWGAVVLGLALLGVGALGARRMGRGRRG